MKFKTTCAGCGIFAAAYIARNNTESAVGNPLICHNMGG